MKIGSCTLHFYPSDIHGVLHDTIRMADRGVTVQNIGNQGSQVQAMIGNINSPSVVSLASACR